MSNSYKILEQNKTHIDIMRSPDKWPYLKQTLFCLNNLSVLEGNWMLLAAKQTIPKLKLNLFVIFCNDSDKPY